MPESIVRRRFAPFVFALAAAALALPPAHAQSLSGSAASLDRQNRHAALNDFTFLRTSADVTRFVDLGLLVPVGGNDDYSLDAVSYPVARPEVRLFLERLGRQYHAFCGDPLVVTSLTRPESDQPTNASPRSVHPTGMAIDLRRPLVSRCRAWLESTLSALERKAVLEVTLEHSPPHLHVAVFPQRYATYVAALTSTPLATVLQDARRTPTYTVQPADTLWDISQQFGTTPAAIRRANNLRSDLITPGQVLEIPDDNAK
jgi:LysM repeat protein